MVSYGDGFSDQYGFLGMQVNCVSTIEAIVSALSLLEPHLEEQLNVLLNVFESMVEDQKLAMRTKQPPQR